jgi:tetratricopeptide (TPR) repeat protein
LVARFSGRPVLVFMAEDWCGYCERLEGILAHRDLSEAVGRFVTVKMSPDEHPEPARTYKVDMHHQLVMLDWSGQVISKLVEFKTAHDVAVAVSEAAAGNDLRAAAKLVEFGYYAKAAERYHIVLRISRAQETLVGAAEGLTGVRAAARKRINSIRQLIRANRPDEAADACSAFMSDFPPEMGKREVEGLLAKLASGKPVDFPEERETVEKSPADKAAEEARRFLERGMVFEWDRLFFEAVTRYEKVVKLYPDTPCAQEADERLKLLLEDDETRALVEKQKMDKHCTRWLEMGKLYERYGRDDLARPYYARTVAAYPDSHYAVEAGRHLAEIDRRSGVGRRGAKTPE